MNTNPILAEKRQKYHRLLLKLGEEKYKSVIVEGTFNGIESTTDLNEQQLDILIADANTRLGQKGYAQRKPIAPAHEPEQAELRRLRNKCLLVLAERGIKATAKDWSAINKELEAARYQWILTDEQRAAGVVNKRGLTAFNTPETLKKLFMQLSSIRDNQRTIGNKIKKITVEN